MRRAENTKIEPYEDNSIEFSKGSKVATVSVGRKSMVTHIKKLAEKFPKECKIVAVNPDGSICAHVPTTWVHIEPDGEVKDEEVKKNNVGKDKTSRRKDLVAKKGSTGGRSKRRSSNSKP